MAVGNRESGVGNRTSRDHAIRLTAANTTVSFSVRWLGALRVRGRFGEIEGSLTIPDSCIEKAELVLEVSAASLRTGIALRDRHLRGHRFLDAERYPRISFRSTRIERPNGVLVVSGVLTVRGTERAISAVCPLRYADGGGGGGGGGGGLQSLVRLPVDFAVPRLAYGVGVARGLRGLNPLLRAIGDRVSLHAEVVVPATQLLPALLPALGQ